MTYDVDVTTETRAPLTRDAIVAAAVEFADAHGIGELSMRKLGAELGVEAMSLYNHVADKGDIHDGMIDRVFESISLPDDGADWKQSIRMVGASALDQFTKHEWVVPLLMERGNFGPGALAFMNRVLGILRDSGFSDEDTQHAWQMLASHTMGYAFQAATNPAALQDELTTMQLLLARSGERFPHVVALAPHLAQCDFASEYRFGLEIIIDGLEARLGQTR